MIKELEIELSKELDSGINTKQDAGCHGRKLVQKNPSPDNSVVNHAI